MEMVFEGIFPRKTLYFPGCYTKHVLKDICVGYIEILEAFWSVEHNLPYPNLVHPILIYADLLTTGDTRNLETAEIVYERELARLIRQD